jgi:hypothetical protein
LVGAARVDLLIKMRSAALLILFSGILPSYAQLPNIILILTDDEDLMLGGMVP